MPRAGDAKAAASTRSASASRGDAGAISAALPHGSFE